MRLSRFSRSVLVLAVLAALACMPGSTAHAEDPGLKVNQPAERCPGPVASAPPRALPVAFDVAALGSGEVRLTFLGHATFLIESPGLVRIATDYNDYVRTPLRPDIITMNHAHTTHFTEHPDPGIRYVLRGWNDDGTPAIHDLTYRDVRVHNVPTNIRDGAGGTERYGNSIFIFEAGRLCIAHLGHLHHTLTPAELAAIGPVDVVMAPVDGTYTLDLDGMIEVLGALKAPVMIPMHYFNDFTLERFLARVPPEWRIVHHETASVVLSRDTLPLSSEVLVLPGP